MMVFIWQYHGNEKLFFNLAGLSIRLFFNSHGSNSAYLVRDNFSRSYFRPKNSKFDEKNRGSGSTVDCCLRAAWVRAPSGPPEIQGCRADPSLYFHCEQSIKTIRLQIVQIQNYLSCRLPILNKNGLYFLDQNIFFM